MWSIDMSSGMVTVLNSGHAANALSPIASTESGIEAVVIPVHAANADLPTVTTEPGIQIDDSAVHL